MYIYAKLNENNIVEAIISSTNEVKENGLIKVEKNVKCGMKWNGKTFEEVPTEESDNVSRETSMSDLEDYCLTIIELLTDAKEGE